MQDLEYADEVRLVLTDPTNGKQLRIHFCKPKIVSYQLIKNLFEEQSYEIFVKNLQYSDNPPI